ncbi:MAG TPA: redox-sensing transcriptional repressor Rex [Armatimonadota bacterium]
MKRAQIFRLEHYLMRLMELKIRGAAYATSDALADAVGVSGSRVRQDMMALQAVGKPHSGYSVDELEIRIRDALDLYRPKGMAIVGCGNLGHALANAGIWERAGFTVRAAFDVDPAKVGQSLVGVTIRHLDELPGALADEPCVAACLTVPTEVAQTVANLLVDAGVKGIWNFASVDVKAPMHVVIENQRLEFGLMTLSYLLKLHRPPKTPPSGG